MSSDGRNRAFARPGSLEKQKSVRGHITAFYIETLVLAVIFVVVILALTRVFSLSVRLSSQAEDLTSAVRLAENAAEAVAASDSPGRLAELLDENGNVKVQGDGSVLAEYDRDRKPAPGGVLRVEITWEPGEDGCVDSVITVSRAGDPQPVYTLTTAVFTGEAVP